jgi:hypothetical protein
MALKVKTPQLHYYDIHTNQQTHKQTNLYLNKIDVASNHLLSLWSKKCIKVYMTTLGHIFVI